jgi:hypothetical protein
LFDSHRTILIQHFRRGGPWAARALVRRRHPVGRETATPSSRLATPSSVGRHDGPEREDAGRPNFLLPEVFFLFNTSFRPKCHTPSAPLCAGSDLERRGGHGTPEDLTALALLLERVDSAFFGGERGVLWSPLNRLIEPRHPAR